MSEGLVETVYPPSKLLQLWRQFYCIDVGLSLLPWVCPPTEASQQTWRFMIPVLLVRILEMGLRSLILKG